MSRYLLSRDYGSEPFCCALAGACILIGGVTNAPLSQNVYPRHSLYPGDERGGFTGCAHLETLLKWANDEDFYFLRYCTQESKDPEGPRSKRIKRGLPHPSNWMVS
ncbi:hypothetical protein MRX96_025142 [Rhipicephalus microplus]